MTTSSQKYNLQELLVALQGIKNNKNESPLSPELEMLLKSGLHHSCLPDTLHTSAAEAFQLAFEAWGGIPRLLLFADRYPGSFLKLYARQTAATMAPVIPQPLLQQDNQEWPEWMNAQRLQYRLGVDQVDTPDDD
jgi:hypothetical protein